MVECDPMNQIKLLLLAALSLPLTAEAGTFVVVNTNDSGAGSLREAIEGANGSFGLDKIEFNIPGSGVHTITTALGMPFITDPVLLDGRSQPGFEGVPLIELKGSVVLDDGF